MLLFQIRGPLAKIIDSGGHLPQSNAIWHFFSNTKNLIILRFYINLSTTTYPIKI
jgi:hypothetical protein